MKGGEGMDRILRSLWQHMDNPQAAPYLWQRTVPETPARWLCYLLTAVGRLADDARRTETLKTVFGEGVELRVTLRDAACCALGWLENLGYSRDNLTRCIGDEIHLRTESALPARPPSPCSWVAVVQECLPDGEDLAAPTGLACTLIAMIGWCCIWLAEWEPAR